jgi:hypothetical protein
MARCEDYPCCGHTDDEGCPDPALIEAGYFPYRCVECGGLIKKGTEAPGHESFHASCLDNMQWGEEDREDEDY